MALRSVADSVGEARLPYVSKSGEEFSLKQLTLGDIAKFEEWLVGRAIQAVRSGKAFMSEKEYASAIKEVAADAAKGRYTFGGAEASEAMKTGAGVLRMLEILIDAPAARVRQLLEEEGDDLVEYLKFQVERSMPENKDGGDPGEGNPKGGKAKRK